MILQVIFAILQLHFLTVYLADPVVGGFMIGAACHVFASQMPKLIGVQVPPRCGPYGLLKLPYVSFFLKTFYFSIYYVFLPKISSCSY